MDKQVLIIGAGGHGKVIADIILRCGDHVLGFLDDNIPVGTLVSGLSVLGSVKDYHQFISAEFILGIGSNCIREQLSECMGDVSWYTAIHPNACISSMDVIICEGTVVMAGAVINSGSMVGKHCIINTGAIIEHDNTISDYCHISVGAKTAGTVYVGARTVVGIGAIVSNNLHICQDCMIGAGAVVVNSIDNPGVYIGIPARRK